MGPNTTVHADAMTDATLAAHLGDLRENAAGWRGPVGSAVLTEARARYAKLSQRYGMDQSDGATYAWTYWTQELTDAQLAAHTADLWKFTGGVIARQMAAEATAASRLTSVQGVRRSAMIGADSPLRLDSADDIAAVAADLAVDPFADTAEAPDRPLGQRQAIAALRQLLVMAALTPMQRDLIVEELARHLDQAANPRAAVDAMTRDVPEAMPLGAERWKALVALVLGTAKGTPGLIDLIGQGHPDPMAEPHMQKLLPVFLRATPGAAAGVA